MFKQNKIRNSIKIQLEIQSKYNWRFNQGTVGDSIKVQLEIQSRYNWNKIQIKLE